MSGLLLYTIMIMEDVSYLLKTDEILDVTLTATMVTPSGEQNFEYRLKERDLSQINIKENEQLKELIQKTVEHRMTLEISFLKIEGAKTQIEWERDNLARVKSKGGIEEGIIDSNSVKEGGGSGSNFNNSESKKELRPNQEQNDAFEDEQKLPLILFKMKKRYFFSVKSRHNPNGRMWNRDKLLPVFFSAFKSPEILRQNIMKSIQSINPEYFDIRESREFKEFLRYQALKMLPPLLEENRCRMVTSSFLLGLMNRVFENNDPLLEDFRSVLKGPLFRARAALESGHVIRTLALKLRKEFFAGDRKEMFGKTDVMIHFLEREIEKLTELVREIKVLLFQHFELIKMENLLDTLIINFWRVRCELGNKEKKPVYIRQIERQLLGGQDNQEFFRKRKYKILEEQKQAAKLGVEVSKSSGRLGQTVDKENVKPNQEFDSNIFMDLSDDSKRIDNSEAEADKHISLSLKTLDLCLSSVAGLSQLLSTHIVLNTPFQIRNSGSIINFARTSLKANSCLIDGRGFLYDKWHYQKYFVEQPTLNLQLIENKLVKKSKNLKNAKVLLKPMIIQNFFKSTGVFRFVQDLMIDLSLGRKTESIFLQAYSQRRSLAISSDLQSLGAFSLPRNIPKNTSDQLIFTSNKDIFLGPNQNLIYSYNHFEKLESEKSAAIAKSFFNSLNWREHLGDQFLHTNVRDIQSFSLHSLKIGPDESCDLAVPRRLYLDFFFSEDNIPHALDFVSHLLAQLVFVLHSVTADQSASVLISQICFLHSDDAPIEFPSLPVPTAEKLLVRIKSLLSSNQPIYFKMFFQAPGPKMILKNSHSIDLYISATINSGMDTPLFLNNYSRYLPPSDLLFRGFFDFKDREVYSQSLDLHRLSVLNSLKAYSNRLFSRFEFGIYAKWTLYKILLTVRQESARKILSTFGLEVFPALQLASKAAAFARFLEVVLAQEIGSDLDLVNPKREYESKASNQINSSLESSQGSAHSKHNSKTPSRFSNRSNSNVNTGILQLHPDLNLPGGIVITPRSNSNPKNKVQFHKRVVNIEKVASMASELNQMVYSTCVNSRMPEIDPLFVRLGAVNSCLEKLLFKINLDFDCISLRMKLAQSIRKTRELVDYVIHWANYAIWLQIKVINLDLI